MVVDIPNGSNGDEDMGELLSSDGGDEKLPLPFLWATLPREHLGIDAHRTRVRTEKWSTLLSSGREISLATLHQSHTYAGVLCGLPRETSNNESPIQSAIALASQLFPLGGDRPVILPPMMQRVTVRNRRWVEGDIFIAESDSTEVDFLPPVVSIGSFDSSPARDHSESNSSLVVIWFQSAFGPPEAGYVMREISILTWDTLAIDWTW